MIISLYAVAGWRGLGYTASEQIFILNCRLFSVWPLGLYIVNIISDLALILNSASAKMEKNALKPD
jgi:hypothetical protein